MPVRNARNCWLPPQESTGAREEGPLAKEVAAGLERAAEAEELVLHVLERALGPGSLEHGPGIALDQPISH